MLVPFGLQVCKFFLWLNLPQENQPECIACQTSNTIKCILIECSDFVVFRIHFYNTNNMSNTFKIIRVDNILSFMKDIKLYQKILQYIQLELSPTNLLLKTTPNAPCSKELQTIHYPNQERSLEKHKNKFDCHPQFTTWHKIAPNSLIYC